MCAVFEPEMMWYENGSRAIVAIEDFRASGPPRFTVWRLSLSGMNESEVIGREIDREGVKELFRMAP